VTTAAPSGSDALGEGLVALDEPDTSPVHQIHERLAPFDAAVDEALDRLRGNPVADRLLYGATELGDFGLIWHLLAWSRALYDPRRFEDAVWLSGSLAVESLVVNQGIKRLFGRERPVPDFERPYRIRTPLTSSFPSGHSSSALMSTIVLSRDDPAWPLYVVVAAAVSTSRAYVRIHHPSDVAAGVVLGTGLGLFVRGLRRYVRHRGNAR
jgi:undecaprenyl-diphosphatase